MNEVLAHHGILGQKWGVRRYQNEDGSLTPEGERHRQQMDQRWAKKNYKKIYNNTYKEFQKELRRNGIRELDERNSRKLRRSVINSYNRAMAEIMNAKVGDISSPSGQVIQFVAKRGELGVHMVLTDPGFDVMKEYKNGIWSNGRRAYRKTIENKMEV